MCTLFSTGIEQARRTSAIHAGNGKFAVCLGAVSCSFQKEVKPYERYEMWTRVLSWDHKWIYIVTHFIRKNKSGRTMAAGTKRPDRPLSGTESVDENLILASALSKCVFKKGRRTITPEAMLGVSGLMPTRSGVTAAVPIESLPSPLRQMPSTDDAVELFFKMVVKLDDVRMSIESYLSILFRKNRSGKTSKHVDYSFRDQGEKVDESTWESIECERQRGMEMANLLAGLGGLDTEFRAAETLAKHRDL